MSDNASSMRHTEDKIDSTHFAHHIISPKIYLVVILILLALTIATVLVAYVNFSGLWNLVIALGLATVKATIVCLWFMHVRYSGKLIQIVIVTSLLFLMLMLFGVLMDVWTRTNVTPAGYIDTKPDWEQSAAIQEGEGGH